ncbi:Spy/CpxP family protein refolding chaperone [Methylococcus mesophilus]|uniref:Spy/CpxP family protein refolding chaperone n=1 Tax=Methylococcus mesophilus TaxID=2993564 RepID=UPI00224AD4C6|nr:Spy/CpxP family protein refolding chaperone [Methylococcus mesophilus]UZR30374.1 Spy/CpxP family protein refolding chaperone [Methylococcus mesophilus]
MKRYRSLSQKLMAAAVFAGLASAISTAGAFPSPKPDPEERLAAMLWRIHGELNLNGEQDGLWKRAEDDTRQMTKSHRERFETAQKDIKSALSDGSADLRALFDKLDADKSSVEARMKENRKLWLSFYDSLDPTQKKTVNAQLLAELDRMGPMPADGKCRFAPGKAEGNPLPPK